MSEKASGRPSAKAGSDLKRNELGIVSADGKHVILDAPDFLIAYGKERALENLRAEQEKLKRNGVTSKT